MLFTFSKPNELTIPSNGSLCERVKEKSIVSRIHVNRLATNSSLLRLPLVVYFPRSFLRLISFRSDLAFVCTNRLCSMDKRFSPAFSICAASERKSTEQQEEDRGKKENRKVIALNCLLNQREKEEKMGISLVQMLHRNCVKTKISRINCLRPMNFARNKIHFSLVIFYAESLIFVALYVRCD